MEGNIWLNQPYGDIVDYIIKNYHKKLSDQLKDLSKLTTTIMRVHGLEHEELFEVHRLFHTIQINMVQHVIRQETRIFPLIKRYSIRPIDELLDKAIKEINIYKEKEDNTEELLSKLKTITNNYTAPQDGCMTYDRTYELLKELHENIMEHLKLEDEILFKRILEEKVQ
ncbi:MAG: hypothetical protein GXZ06_00520 [Tissierellia bacterium]|nr:hypothetical protein [Tissierellia bacterium]